MVRISSSRLDMEDGRIDRGIFKDYGETLVGGVDGLRTTTSGYALDFEDNATAVIQANADFNTDNFSICFWIKPNQLRTQSIINKTDFAVTWRIFMGAATGEIVFDARNDVDNLSIGVSYYFLANEWTHCVATYNKTTTTARLYKNSVLGGSTSAFTNAGNDQNLNFQISPGGIELDGLLDEVRFYNRELSAAEVTAVFSNSAPLNGLVGYWPFNEGEGATVYDLSGNSHDGTISGTPTWVNDNPSNTCHIDLAEGNAYHVILNANSIFTFDNPTPVGTAQTFTLYVKQDTVGGRTVTWPSSVQWVQGYVPTLTSQKNRYDVFQFTTTNAGATWLGFVGGQNFEEKGTIWTFGNGAFGRLGHNDTVLRSSPTMVGALTGWQTVKAGNRHTVAVKNDGTLWSWGYSGNGQLGHNSTTSRSSPTQVGAAADWSEVSTLVNFNIAIRGSGTLWSWGEGSSGKLGRSTVVDTSSPAQIGALSTWMTPRAGSSHSLALKTDGTLWGWGSSGNGQLGRNDTTSTSSPVQMGSNTTWADIAIGSTNSFALKTDGTLWSWGSNSSGRLGHSDALDRSSPTQIGTSTNWYKILARSEQAFALKTDGTLWSWGSNDEGRLGQNDIAFRSSPTQIGSEEWHAVAVGGYHAVGLKPDGTVWTWGRMQYGAHGQNDAVLRSSPTQLGTLNNWKIISAGVNSSALIQFP